VDGSKNPNHEDTNATVKVFLCFFFSLPRQQKRAKHSESLGSSFRAVEDPQQASMPPLSTPAAHGFQWQEST
jgi:hypothetical protein